jgi:UDP-N-acetylmuramoyl-tripeptide--D-alanyl-D-alanine ligase
VIPLRLAEIDMAAHVRGDPGSVITGIVADSRLARPGALFVCLHGSRQDGHDFIADAAARGAVAALCERGRAPEMAGPPALLEADEPLAALGGIARLARRRSQARVVGVAGSAGKTSAKDTLRSLLAAQLATVASPASFNNELGVPLTLALIEPETDVCVCELGTGAPGEMSSLCAIAEPELGLITAIGPEHLESFGTLEAVAAEEAALIAALPPGASLVLPEQAPLLEPHRRADLEEWRFGFGFGFGLGRSTDVSPLAWRPSGGATDAVFSVRGERVVLQTNLRHPHHRLTLAAAIAVCAALGFPLERIREGAAQIELSPWRGQEQALPQGGTLINDAYNANPISMEAALAALSARRDGGRAIAVLGEMAELGPRAARWHVEAGRHAARLGIDLLVAVGPGALPYLDGAAGDIECCWFPDTETATAAIEARLGPGDVVLVKGSRRAALETLAEAIAR